MSNHRKRLALAGACAALAVLTGPAVSGASASGLWVSNSAAVSSPGKSCAHPGYSSIQAAIEASSGGVVNVCPGTYAEQLVISGAVKLVAVDGAGSATVKLPATIAASTSTCDTAPGNLANTQDEISICTSATVSITDLTVEAHWPAGTCNDSLYGIIVSGGATLKATDMTIDGAGDSPINGCQGGVGIEVGSARTTPSEIGRATLKHSSISGYQKNGVTVEGEGSSVNVISSTVTGAGATDQIAQNGVQISYGATGTIKSSVISGNECDNAACGSNGFESAQGAGVLLYEAGKGTKVLNSTIKDNDMGAYFYSGSPTQSSTPEATISKDAFTANRYEGIALDQGDASIKGDTITGGDIGIDLFQYEAQAYAPDSSASTVTIEGASKAAVEVQSDKAAGDHPGSFTISRSSVSKNATDVQNESTTFTVTKSHDS